MEGQTGMSVLFFLNSSIHLTSRMSIEVGAKLRQGFGHIVAPESEADVARLIINSARKQQDPGIADHFFAESEDIALGLEVRKTDRAGVGFHPFEPTRALLDESVEQ